MGSAEALEMARKAKLVIVCKGKKVTRFEMKKDRPADADLEEHMLGPTGNLRAPLLKIGKTIVVGYNEEVYREVL